MAYSTVTITFIEVPPLGSYLTLTENSVRERNFTETFRNLRNQSLFVTLPKNLGGGLYSGFVSEYFAQAFQLDHNVYDEYTIEFINGAAGSGLGQVIITAKYPGAVFSAWIGENSGAILNFSNKIPVPGVSPTSIIFNGATSDPQIPAQNVQIVANGSWSITSILPSWLEILQLSGSGHHTSILKPINYSGLNAGTYDHQLIYQIGSEQFTVSIQLQLFKTVQSPYESGKPAFSLDQKNFIIQGENTDTYFQFDSTITIYKFFNDEIETKFIPQKVLLFNGKAEINIGKLIHRLMDNFPTINNFLKQYKLANLDISCKEKKLSDDTVIETIDLLNIKFAAGLSTKFSNFGFLEFNQKPSRVTKNGFYFLNILILSGNYELRTFKNGNLIGTKLLPIDSDGPICQKILFSNYEKGDVIDCTVDLEGQNTENAPTKRFYIFPDQQFSNIIVWENEFLLQSSLEFTNDHDVKMEIERQTSKTFNRYVEKTIHHSVSKENKLTINTGWVSKNDIDSVESLLLSKRAFLDIDGKTIEMAPLGKSLTNYDSKAELYDYTFEFTINRIYNEETYTF